MQEYPGCLSFTTDAWTSPNHRAYVAVSVHLEKKGVPFSMILDIIEVAEVRLYLPAKSLIPTPYIQSHSGANLATVLARVFEEFNISEKVSLSIRLICSWASLTYLSLS